MPLNLSKNQIVGISIGAVVVIIIGVAIALAAGGGDDEQTAAPRSTTTTSTTPTTVPAGPTMPLTGLPGEPPARPALVVKIDNAPRARPQAGLNQADVVIAEAVEGGITRLFTIFHSTDADPVGPVRSARTTDILLATPMNRPLFAFSGANEAFLRLIRQAPLVDVGVDVQSGAYRRDSGRPQTYNLMSSTGGLWGNTPQGAGPPPPMFTYRPPGQPLPEAGARLVPGVRVQYRDKVETVAEWRWDGGRGGWARTQNGTAHNDAAGNQVVSPNVIVQFVGYHDTGFRDLSNTAVPEAELVGEGEAWMFTDGKVVVGRWRKPSPEAVTEYLGPNGQPVGLTPGRTWVELVPSGNEGSPIQGGADVL